MSAGFPDIQEELEKLLMEGLQSGEATEMTEEDWLEIRAEGLRQLEIRQSSHCDRHVPD